MESKDMNLNGSNMVVMHNDLIKSKSELSLNEIKLLRLAIMQVVREDKDLQTYKVNIIDLAKTLNIDNHNLYRDMEDICKHLKKEIVYIGDGNPKHKWKMFSWVDLIQYEEGVLTIKLSDQLKPYILELSQLYTQYFLEDILYLKSVYSIRIYELIRQEMKYQKVYAEHKADVYLSIDTIRKATNTEDKYSQIINFKKKVIDKAVDEINDKLSYYITYEPVKESRKIIGFNFHVVSKSSKEYRSAKKKSIIDMK